MTTELAIRILTGDVLGTNEQTHEAVKMAVKALSNTNGETIYRQAAIDAAVKESQIDGAYGYMDTKSIVDLLSSLPSAQPEYTIKMQESDIDEAVKLVRDARVTILPSAQPEIIRCKDCKWCEDTDGLMCKNTASWVVATDYDFGCILAERRQDE